MNEEALSVNEEYQSTNEELLTSKEELQSLNEELTALNSQLQETLERQRTTSNDLQNVLYSTRRRDPVPRPDLQHPVLHAGDAAVFSVIPAISAGRWPTCARWPPTRRCCDDAAAVLPTAAPRRTRDRDRARAPGTCRRVLPYRTQDDGVEGVVITFADITERKQTARALRGERQRAEQANAAKSRFLAAASHDLRQPLQTLTLLQGCWRRRCRASEARKLVARLGTTLGAMSGMLNTLLDINQIEAGTVAGRRRSTSRSIRCSAGCARSSAITRRRRGSTCASCPAAWRSAATRGCSSR